MSTVQAQLRTTIDRTAAWRDRVASSWIDDDRNPQAARMLRELGEYVAALPDDHLTVRLVSDWTEDDLDHVPLGEEANEVLRRVGFGLDASCDVDELFVALSTAIERDAFRGLELVLQQQES